MFQIDYHSFAKLILYPEGWQVETPATDAPLMKALAGDSAHAGGAGLRPRGLGAAVHDQRRHHRRRADSTSTTQSYTVELDGGTGDPVGGTDGSTRHYTPGGFVFQDSEADVQAEFEKNLPFALDLAKSATHPDDPTSHLGNTAPAMVPTTFATSYGNPQTVEVNAKRSLGAITAHWTSTAAREQTAADHAVRRRQALRRPGRLLPPDARPDHRRARGRHGDRVVHGRRQDARSRSPTRQRGHRQPVLLMVAEDYTGNSALSAASRPRRTTRATTPRRSTARASATTSTTSTPRAARRRSQLGVLSHYKAVVWETGDDVYVREPDQPRRDRARQKLFDDEILNARDYMNEGGKLLVAGQPALEGAWDCSSSTTRSGRRRRTRSAQQPDAGQRAGRRPAGPGVPCIVASNDFMQYWLGAYQNGDGGDPARRAARGRRRVGATEFGLNGADSARQPAARSYRFLTTSSVLPEAPTRSSRRTTAIVKDGPPAYDPPEGTPTCTRRSPTSRYKRLTTTVDLTGPVDRVAAVQAVLRHRAGLRLRVRRGPHGGPGRLDDAARHQRHHQQDVGAGCPDADPFWLLLHPFLNHYLTRTATPRGGFACAPHGTSGSWNAATGNSGGFQRLERRPVAVRRQAGRGVDHLHAGPGLARPGRVRGRRQDHRRRQPGRRPGSRTGHSARSRSAGPPEGSPGNANNWTRTTTVGFQDGPGVRTDHSVYWGFGLEGVRGADTRRDLLKNALTYLGV